MSSNFPCPEQSYHTKCAHSPFMWTPLNVSNLLTGNKQEFTLRRLIMVYTTCTAEHSLHEHRPVDTASLPFLLPPMLQLNALLLGSSGCIAIYQLLISHKALRLTLYCYY